MIWAFLWRDILNEISYKLSFYLQLLSIFPTVLMFFFLSRLFGNFISGPLHPYGGNYFSFVLIGVALQNYLTLSLSSFSRSLRDSQLSGTLEVILTTPVRLHVFLLGSTAYSFVLNSLRVLIYLIIGSLFIEVRFDWAQIPLVLVALVLTITAFSSLGIFSASFIIMFKKGDPLNWAFSVVSWLLGGVYYPISVLPDWLQKAALLIPMTHALEAIRLSLLRGQGLSSIGKHLLALGLWAAIGLPLSLICFRYSLNQARVKGTLGHY